LFLLGGEPHAKSSSSNISAGPILLLQEDAVEDDGFFDVMEAASREEGSCIACCIVFEASKEYLEGSTGFPLDLLVERLVEIFASDIISFQVVTHRSERVS